ncbi:16.0 kDa heat shock protein, peroxisomal [Acorus calamus]|uniref:16.0 kDa heat shock protein, peroxisomal n=1 Tax=Acorus calamus TaxID=4465 RepID=A0AAV9DMS9_ACOCL|nr:16.0 kDa heat shock protein, peroxisomal [Acorus calamus]
MAEPFFPDPFRRFFRNPPIILHDWSGSTTADTDWVETPSAHIFKFNVPGFGKDGIKVQLNEGNVLNIKGEATTTAKYEELLNNKDVIWHLSERPRGDFSRQFGLPDHVKADQIKASVDNGVLTVVVPKDAPPKPRSRTISVSSKL